MAKTRTQHVCSECGHIALSWQGQCPGCGAWNALEQRAAPAGSKAKPLSRSRARAGAGSPRLLREVEAERSQRLLSGIGEFDRVLGGGMVPGSLVLLGGAPGIGKSTLASMALANCAAGAKVLYVSGEESAAQIRTRAARLGDAALDVPVLAEPSLETVLA